MDAILFLATLALAPRLKRLENMRRRPVESQTRVFRYLIQQLAETEYGKTHQIHLNTTENEFSRRIPLRDYESFYPWIEASLKGEKNVLWPGQITWFSKSSGTTNDRSKFIPVSRESLVEGHFKAGRDMVAAYVDSHPSTQIFKGKQLSLGGSIVQNPHRDNSWIGDISAILIRNLPAFYEYFRTPGRDIALMAEWEPKIELLAKSTMNQKVASAAGVPSWMLILWRKILELKQKKTICEVWPGFEVFFHGGVSFEPYRESFKHISAGGNLTLVETYNASEGFFAFQDSDKDTGMLLLADHGIYYEFIPMDSKGELNTEPLPLEGVTCGKNYAIVISTNGGLWRFMPGDTVRFTSLFPHKIIVTGRTKHFINMFGEELMVENADKAIHAASAASGAEVENYSAGPVFLKEGESGRHLWIVEFKIPPLAIAAFISKLDESLQEQNSDYAAKRQGNLLLGLPDVKEAPPGTFQQWLKEKNRLGAQAKIQRLSNSESWIKELLAFSERGF